MKLQKSGKYYFQVRDGEKFVGGASQLSNGQWIAVDTHDNRVAGSPIMGGAIEVRKYFERMAEESELLQPFRALLQEYVNIINSGDCGFWNPEESKVVIDARAAIAKAESVRK